MCKNTIMIQKTKRSFEKSRYREREGGGGGGDIPVNRCPPPPPPPPLKILAKPLFVKLCISLDIYIAYIIYVDICVSSSFIILSA